MKHFLLLLVLALTFCAVASKFSKKKDSSSSDNKPKTKSDEASKSKSKSSKHICGKTLGEYSVVIDHQILILSDMPIPFIKTCDNGYWTGICVQSKDYPRKWKQQICRQACNAQPALDASANVELVDTYDLEHAWEGSKLTVRCVGDFTPAEGSDMTITCVNGTWSGFTGKCHKACDSRHSFEIEVKNTVKNNLVEGATFTEGGIIVFSCKDGHESKETNYAECQADGSWKTVGPGCVKGCDYRPAVPSNAELFDDAGGTSLGAVVSYKCVAGTSSDIPEKHICTVYGWQLIGAECLGTPICPVNWRFIGSSCYYTPGPETVKNFFDSQDYCTSLDAASYLLQLETEGESNAVKGYLLNEYGAANWWLGVSDLALEGTWIWAKSGDQVTFTDWINPPEERSSYNFAIIQDTTGWYPIDRRYLYVPVCEKSVQQLS